jgi:hypothetical protein
MNRERAETCLRQLAEAELLRAMKPAAGVPGRRNTARLALVAQALVAVGAIDVGTADQIRADLEFAVATRQLTPGQPPRAVTVALPAPGLSAAHTRPAPPRASWRAVPVGQAIQIPDYDGRHEFLVVTYLQSAGGARFIMAGWPFRPFTAADDRGASYQVSYRGRPGLAEFLLSPDPPYQIRWLDLVTAPGQPATRIDLDPQIPPPHVTVTRKETSPGELMLDVIAARIFGSGVAFPQDNLEQPPAGRADLRAFIGDGPGLIVAALHAAGALPPASPVPGQLAGLCDRLGIPGHGITAPPAADLPEPWRSLLTSYHRREPQSGPAPGILAATVVELPELDGAQITILGLHHGERDTIVHMLASGVAPEGDWEYSRGVRPLPVLWIRDSAGRWHATRTTGIGPSGDSGEVVLWLRTVPPLDRGTAWIDVVATGSSAEVRARLPLSWK